MVFAQNITRSYVVTQDANQGEVGAYYFTQGQIDTWYNANKTKITKLGRVYIIPGTASGSTFHDVVNGNGATKLGGAGSGTPIITDRKTLRDMGKEVIIGNSADTRLLVLRLVQKYTDSTVGYSGDSDNNVYIPVENNCEDLPSGGRFTVRVARI